MTLQAKKIGDRIVIKTDSFQRIMDCLYNQKILLIEPEGITANAKKTLEAIDACYQDGMEVLIDVQKGAPLWNGKPVQPHGFAMPMDFKIMHKQPVPLTWRDRLLILLGFPPLLDFEVSIDVLEQKVNTVARVGYADLIPKKFIETKSE